MESVYDVTLDFLQEFVIQANLNDESSLMTIWDNMLERWNPAVPFVIDCMSDGQAVSAMSALDQIGLKRRSKVVSSQSILVSEEGSKTINSHPNDIEVLLFDDADRWMGMARKFVTNENT